MLADALWSEVYRLIRNRTALFLGVFFVPLMFAVGGVAFHVLSKSKGDALAAQAALPAGMGGQPVDLALAFDMGAGGGANGAALAFMLIAAAVVYAGDYRWETWRLISARNTRPMLLMGKVGVMKLAALAAMVAYLLASVVFILSQALVTGRPLTFDAGSVEPGRFLLVFLLSYVRIVQYGLVALLAAVLTRSLLAALFVPLVVGFVQTVMGGPLMGLVGWTPTMWAPQLLLPGLAYDTLKAAATGEAAPAGVVSKAILGLALWCLVPFGAALARFSRQDLSKE